MKKLNLIIAVLLLGGLIVGCNKEEGDREQIVTMTLYPETGYGASVMSDIWTEPLMFSDSEDTKKQMLVDIITEGFEFEFERGFEYKIKAKKIWMQTPPQDVSSVKYVFIELLSKTKVITEDSEKNMALFVSSNTVQFTPKYPTESEIINGVEGPKIYNALHVQDKESNQWLILPKIEGFDYEEGFEYTLSVKKVTQATPYSVKYVLLNIVSKEEKN